MKNHTFYFFILLSSSLFAYPINERGVGPANSIPSLSLNEQGEALVAWSGKGNIAGEIHFSFFDPAIQTFSPYKTLKNAKGIYPSASLTNEGNGLLVFDTTTGPINYVAFDKRAGNIFNVKKISSHSLYSHSPFLSCSISSKICSAISSQGYALYSVLENPSQSFPPFIQIDSFQIGKTLFNLTSKNKTLLIASSIDTNTIYYSVYDAKKGFQDFKKLIQSDESCNVKGCMSEKGVAIITWSSGASRNLFGKIGYSIFDPQRETFTEAAFIKNENQGALPAIAINDEGDALLLWTKLTYNGKEGLWYSFKGREDQLFRDPLQIFTRSLYPTGVDVALNSFQGIACWFSNLSSRIEYSLFDFKNKRFGTYHFIPEAGVSAQYPQIKMNSLGDAIIAWSVFSGVEYSLFDKGKEQFKNAKIASLQRERELGASK